MTERLWAVPQRMTARLRAGDRRAVACGPQE